MAKKEYVGVNAIARNVKKQYVGVNGVARKVKKAYVGVNGVARQCFSGGTPLRELSRGSYVYIPVNGTFTKFTLIEPTFSNPLHYDSSCNGSWLLLESSLLGTMCWRSPDINQYNYSDVHTYLNNNFIGMFNAATQNLIKQVKIPYCVGAGSGTVNELSNGLSTKAFLLSGYELGFTTNDNPYFPLDGIKLTYFDNFDNRVKNFRYWTRSPYTNGSTKAFVVSMTGLCDYDSCSSSNTVLPVIVLPSDVVVDTTNMHIAI